MSIKIHTQKPPQLKIKIALLLYAQLGNAYEFLGAYQQAISYFQKSLEIAREIGDRDGISTSLVNLGNAYNFLEEYQQSLEIKKQIGDRRGEASTWFNLGNTRKNLQQNSEAKTASENARNLYQAVGLGKEVEDCDRSIQNLA
ncbi:hypothetical protein C7B62_14390 [Pleurocapsa sp. CCALA 161]|uniref:tetratricopeptide repeat protein n=1 Tax=Pleurocapsa sp. CCALA 161 TaxID=2107688 RepID=UPI000D05AE40|nr:tetratricopeptide repeat protein [Pleurocapsa sp. CCALA 161]PSB09092.1 hypothetical protein C7B62_14390 [Pleurocapsa sp. CCALA 161]